MTRVLRIAATLVVLASACGDAVVDGDWRGEELFVIEGFVRLDPSAEGIATPPAGEPPGGNGPGPLRVALFWSPARGAGFHLDAAIEQDVATDGLFPARFRLALFAPPDDELLTPVADGLGELAVAVVMAYLDDDRDQTWDRGREPVVGGAPERLLVYTPDGVKSRLFGELAPGFQRIVPIKDCVLRPDGLGFETRYAPDALRDVDLIVSGAFPVELFLDADCDGTQGEWTGVCPPLYKVRTLCNSGPVQPVDATMCNACVPLLSPTGVPAEECDGWLFGCLGRSPADECDTEWRTCRGDGGAPPCPDLPCICQRLYDECKLAGGDPPKCQGKLDDCLLR